MPTPAADGPDISHHNPVANWDAIPQYRVFSTKATEGRTFKSPTFDENWRQMRRRRFEFRGCYHWIRSDSSMADQVANLKRALTPFGGLRDGEFVQLDWETTPGIANVTVAQVDEWMRLADREWPGRVIVYASDWVPGFVEWRRSFTGVDVPVWYANYNTGTTPSGGWAECVKWRAAVWQWTSSYPIPGIADATCDMNHVFDWSTLHTITASTPTPTPTPPPPPPTDPEVIAVFERFHAVYPSRFFDTLGLGGDGVVPADQYGIKPPAPAGATGVKVGVKLVDPREAGYGTVWSGNTPAPGVSSHDYAQGQETNCLIDVPLAADGTFKVYINQPCRVVIDYYGYHT